MTSTRLHPLAVFLAVALAYASVLVTRLANVPTLPLWHLAPLGIFAACLAATALAFRFGRFAGDGPTASLLLLLSGIGIVLQYRIGTLRLHSEAGVASYAFPIGVATMLAVWALCRNGRYALLERAWLPCLATSVVAILAILATGHRYRGAVYAQGNMNPTEIVKPLLVVFLAAVLSAHRESLRRGWLLFPWPRGRAIGTLAILWAPPMALLMLQGDLGMVTLLCAVALVMLYEVSHRGGYLLLAAAGVYLAGRYLIPLSDHAVKRFSAWLDPFSVATEGGWQILQGLVAMYSGGLFGLGVGAGNPSAVPIAESDFIYAVIGEELGYVGCGLTVLLYIALAARGFGIAARARTPFGASLATGITACFSLQALLNIGGVTKAIPLTGITLPFVSHGGSSLVTLFAMAGLLLAISEQPESESPRVPESESPRVRESESPRVPKSESQRVRESESPEVRGAESARVREADEALFRKSSRRKKASS